MSTDWNVDADAATNREIDAGNRAWTAVQSSDLARECDNLQQEQPSTDERENAPDLTGVQLQIYSVLEAVERGELSPDDAARHLDALEAQGERSAGEQNGAQDTSVD